MIIKNFDAKDIDRINYLGNLLHENYVFDLDVFSRCLVMQIDSVVIGYVVYSIIYERAEIIDIIIDPLYRNKSYGYKLLLSCIEDIRLNNCKNITLEVNSNNKAAICLYKKLGFKIEAVREKYYGINDGYLMKKDLR